MRVPVVVGLDNGGTSNNATVLTFDGEFLVGGLAETPSRVREGCEVGIASLVHAFESVLDMVGVPRSAVRAVGLDTPGPASANGVMCAAGSTNFSHPSWRGFDVRSSLEEALGIPVVYNNDANAAALYAHHMHFGADSLHRSSVAAIVGTGLGGGVIENGAVVRGACGMAGELGHVPLPLQDILEPDQPEPQCNCGQSGDAESVASLTGIRNNLLPYWLGRYVAHPLGETSLEHAAFELRRFAEAGDSMALKVFEQQAKAIGVLFTIAANFSDPHAFFVGGGLVETSPSFRQTLLANIRDNMRLRPEQQQNAHIGPVPDLDLAGGRGSAILALQSCGILEPQPQ